MDIRARQLFVNPPYDAVGVGESVSSASIVLSIAMLAALARDSGFDVRIVDLNVVADWRAVYESVLDDFQPTLVGITFATPLADIARDLAKMAKSTGAFTVGGGPHATAVPVECLSAGGFDALVVGEGELAYQAFLDGAEPDSLAGWLTTRKLIHSTAPPIEDLDGLPFAAVDLFNPEDYRYPERSSRANPVCLIETSRGCYARCTFCNKNIFGWSIRKKSARRVVDEIEFMLDAGYAEFHIADDLFTADFKHARGVCQEILRRGHVFPWVPRSGLRVDRVRPDLLELMAAAGCYHIPFGIESGDQATLDRIRKGITLEQVERAISMSKRTDLQTTGYFMVGIPGESQQAMQRTLDFAVSLKLDFVKVGICVPLPGTPMFAEVEESGALRTRDWARFTYSTPPWELLRNDEVSEESMRSLTIGRYNVLEVANRTLVRTEDGSYRVD
jgi:radical SAM superfamily enzyme YgiQ (UPF0313 family)